MNNKSVILGRNKHPEFQSRQHFNANCVDNNEVVLRLCYNMSFMAQDNKFLKDMRRAYDCKN